MIDDPVFIVGTERSGSNLLRLLLNQLPSLHIPHPPHLMRDLTKVLSRFGDLQDSNNFRKLVDVAVHLVELHFAPWPMVIDRDQVFACAKKRDLYSIFAAIYDQSLQATEKKRWGCKSTFMISHVQDVLNHHDHPQFIHLVRDPRDVAVSARTSVFCHYHPYLVARLWKKEQAEAAYWRGRLGSQTWLTLRYEDLIRDPQPELKRVCDFLKDPYSPGLLQYFETPQARGLSDLSRSWENVSRPILTNNSEKFLSQLRPSEIELIEGETWQEMEALNYKLTDPDAKSRHRPSPIHRAQYLLKDNAEMLVHELKAFRQDKNARSRLRKRAYLLSVGLGLGAI